MSTHQFDVLGLGNAIVDVIAPVHDEFLVKAGLHKGSMQLVDEARAQWLYDAMGATTIMSGGSAANTIAGLASLGGKGAFVGKVAADEAGHAFAHDIRATGVHFATAPAADGPSTARCLVLVTPDGQRTMNTFLGACQNLTSADLDPVEVASARILYLEGYLWDPPAAKQAFIDASRIAHGAGREVALTLSDVFCVDRHQQEFLGLMRDGVIDILFANESELHALYQTSDFATAVAALRQEKILAAVTRSEKGAIIVQGERTWEVSAAPIDSLVDTTGAGDLFAAGFLAAYTRGRPLDYCARLGALSASEIIQHFGARPEVELSLLAEQSLYLREAEAPQRA
ncbi:adenosine kinase [Rhodoblastus acidophilus]|uniref:Adenosine kinase n=1 Tax=Candidatus Rhodoblastus alkanivorans TaxID=2954117 RepID=A0ABS9Z1N2_9HYPH|nr:adenosine kinase [Candidatus Rhodoblastus alkanivorans]MCI4678126.1 adenosine kinase [Candidatus Rhodoblastus alkanivorans]MCI4681533.1 adenosine kinase [Candidatus Rhodoblastus alkanivorans]MDI4642581.1 adenosine kinase [Rhodoblastus acidophilus]